MNTPTAWLAGLIAAPFVLYALHRLALRLEADGHLYYLHRKPSGGLSRSFLELQQFVEPQAQHIHQVVEEKKLNVDRGAGGD